jgi:hypothetical protein
LLSLQQKWQDAVAEIPPKRCPLSKGLSRLLLLDGRSLHLTENGVKFTVANRRDERIDEARQLSIEAIAIRDLPFSNSLACR